MKLRRLCYFVWISVSLPAQAYIYCHNQPSIEKQIELLHPATRMGKESRQPIPKAMEQKFAATGLIVCGEATATAQITGVSNLITTAGHHFYDENCQPINRGNCNFEVKRHGKISSIPVKLESLKTGGPCPSDDFNNDWAVVKLQSPVDGVTPYEVPEEDNMLIEGEPIMQVTGMSINYSVNGAFPKSMESCIAEKIDLKHPSPVKHGCDTGGVSSGSAQFAVRNKKMIFAAMNVGGTKNAMDGTEFDADTNYNSSTPVSGRFLRAIKTAMKP